jgi:hypothetical protein
VADFTLEIVEGPNAGMQVSLDRPIEVGRDPGVALILHDELVSRHHARITPTRGGATVEDLGSTNGTFVNGNELHGPTFTSAGDQILVGVSVIQLRSAQQVADRPAAVRQVPAALRVPEHRPDYLPPDLQSADKGGGAPVPGAAGPEPPGFRGALPPGTPPGPTGPVQPVGRPPEVPVPGLDPLLDVNTKRMALIAPLAVFVVVAFALILWLALR